MKERPILFSAPMVRAVLAGRKTQTRRIVKPQPVGVMSAIMTDMEGVALTEWWMATVAEKAWRCPYGKPGDRLWVKETFYCDHLPFSEGGRLPKERPEWADDNLYYRADGECCQQIPECACAEVGKPKWRPSIFMPRWASRITLEVTGVRVERLQDISEADAKAEGCTPWIPCGGRTGTKNRTAGGMVEATHREAYAVLWESINGPGSWKENPCVWVIEFRPSTINSQPSTPQ